VRTDKEGAALDGSPVLTPPAGRAGTVFRLVFKVTEPLAADPTVAFRAPSAGVGVRTFALEGGEGLEYRYTYAVAGDEGEGAAPVEVRLIDASGNIAERLAAGTLRFDFTAPSVAPVADPVNPTVAKDGTAVTVRLGASETLGAPPRVRAGTVAGAMQEGSGPPWSGPFAFTVVVTKAELADGDVPVVARLEDEAGNVAQAAPVGTLHFDTVAPALAQEPEPGAPILRPDDVLSIVLRFTEEPSGVPVVAMQRGEEPPVALERIVSAPVVNTFVHQLRAGEDGDWVVSMSGLTDAAGNVQDPNPRELRRLQVDGRAPAIVGGAPTPPGQDFYKAGDVLRVAFTADEPVAEPELFVKLDGGRRVDLAKESEEPAVLPDGSTGISWAFSHTITEWDEEGTGQITFSLADAAGNRGGPWTLGPVTIDRTAPVLAEAGLSASPASPVPLGANLVVTATAVETLSAASLVSQPALPLGEAIVSGRTAIWSGVVTGAYASGTYVATPTITDRAGNTTILSPLEVVLDTDPPTVLEGYSVGPSPVAADATVRVEFTMSEPTGADGPVVRLGGVEMDAQTDSTDTRFVFAHVAAATENSGAKPVAVRLTDAAGNATTTSLGSVVYDFDAPRLAEADIAVSPRSPIPLGANLTVTATAGEPIASAELSPAFALSLGTPLISGRSAIWSHVVTESDPSGPFDVTVTVTDLAGNRATATRTAAGTLDTSAPHVLAGATVAPSMVRDGATVTAVFAVSEESVAQPVVTLGGVPMELDSEASAGTRYAYSHAVRSSEGTAAKPVLVKLTDTAGNTTTTAIGTVVCDFTPPALTAEAVVATPASPVGLNTNLVVTATADEPLGAYALLETVPALAMGAPVVSGRSVLWSRLVAAGDAAGSFDVTVTVEDLAGNRTTATKTAAFVLDTSAPRVAGEPQVGPSPVRAGATVSARFETTEDMEIAPVVTVGGVAMARDEDSTSRRFAFTLTPEGTEGSGARPVVVVLTDRAGNSTTTPLGLVRFDFDPPALTPDDVAVSPGALLGLGVSLVVTATADEPLETATIGAVPELAFGDALISSRSAIWSHVVAAADAAGVYDLAVTASDAAGNTTTVTKTVAFTLDTTVPEVLAGAAAGPSPVGDGGMVQAAFDTSEPMTRDPSVTLGGAAMAKDAGRSTDTHFVFTHVAAALEGSGPRTVQVSLVDAAGNLSSGPIGTVVYDFDAPVLGAAEVVVTPPSPVGLGASLRISVAATEPLGSAELATAPALAMGEAVISNRTALWSRVVSASDPEGTIDITITVEDLAGNRTTVGKAAAVVLDTGAPVVSDAVVGPSPLRDGATVTATFDVSEAPAADPQVTVGSAAMRKGEASTATRFVYTHAVSATEGSGPKPIVARVVDAAGNAATAALGSVVYDFDPPRLTADDVSLSPPSPVGLNANLTVRAVADETLGAATLVADGAPDFGNAVLSGRGAIWSHLVTAGDRGGTFGLAVTVEDLAGNRTTVKSSAPAYGGPNIVS